MTDPIRHIVLLMLENRSFDQMLGDLQSRVPEIDGIDRAHPRSNADSPPGNGGSIFQQGNAEVSFPPNIDISHEPENVDRQLGIAPPAAPMSGFVNDFRAGKSGANTTIANQVMAYFGVAASLDIDSLPALHGLAENFLVCDRWFSSVPGPTWPNRLFALTGTSAGWRHMPNGISFSGAPYTYSQDTIFDRLAEKGLTGRVYSAGDKSMTWILRKMWFHPDRRASFDQFVKDAAGSESNFPQYALLEPDFFGSNASDQHPPHDVHLGEKLIADAYNAIRQNVDLWQSTLFVVLYDEHGGFYDHVVPPPTIAPDTSVQDGFDFTRFGVRVPAVIVSPWVRRGVCHTLFDHTSLLRYIAEKWDLQPLGERAAAANSLAHALEGSLAVLRSDTPQSLVSIAAIVTRSLAEPNSNQLAIQRTIDIAHSEIAATVPVTDQAKIRALVAAVTPEDCTTKIHDIDASLKVIPAARAIRVLAIHDAAHNDNDKSWQVRWRRAIADGVHAQPNAASLEIETHFSSYGELLPGTLPDASTVASALRRLSGGLVVETAGGAQTDLIGSLDKVEETLRLTAAMVVEWIDNNELRAQLRTRVRLEIDEWQPDVIVAHSLGSLIAYDLLCREVAQQHQSVYKGRTLLTCGSQIAHNAVLPVFDGRLTPLVDSNGAGLTHWFHAYNLNDRTFTRPLPFQDDHTSNLTTSFDSLLGLDGDLLNHNGSTYLSHPACIPFWQAVAARCTVSNGAAPAALLIRPLVQRTKPASHRALLVGINRYPDPKNQLEGCVNDTFLISSVLQEMGIEAVNIRLLLDERATKQSLVAHLDWLVDGMQADDTRLFFYSGHGAQIPAYDETAQPNSFDETLVPYDFDWSRERAFTDDDFRKFYCQLPYDSHLITIFDCCHAGGMARGSLRPRGIDPPDDVRHRALKWAANQQMWVPRDWADPTDRAQKLFSPTTSAPPPATGRRGLGLAGRIRMNRGDSAEQIKKNSKTAREEFGHRGPYLPLMMFACGANELASEYQHGSISYGAFSFVVAKTFRAQHKRKSAVGWKKTISDTAKDLKALGFAQAPEIVGPSCQYETDHAPLALLKPAPSNPAITSQTRVATVLTSLGTTPPNAST